MKQPTKKQQQDEAWEAYEAIVDSAGEAYDAIKNPDWEAYDAIVNQADKAYKAYEAKLKEIDAQPDKVEQIITYDGRQYKLIEEKN